MERGLSAFVGSVDGIIAVAELKGCRDAGLVRKVFAPTDAKRIAAAVGNKVGQAGDCVVSFAVEGLVVSDGAREPAAAEDVGGGVDSAGAGDGLKVRVGARLIQVDGSIVGEKFWI